MTGYPENYNVEIYGDGSYTTPAVWWAALGGYGVWVPEWPSPTQATHIETAEIEAAAADAEKTGKEPPS